MPGIVPGIGNININKKHSLNQKSTESKGRATGVKVSCIENNCSLEHIYAYNITLLPLIFYMIHFKKCKALFFYLNAGKRDLSLRD